MGSVICGQVDGLTRQGLFEVIVTATQDAPQIAGLRVAAYGNKRDQAGCKPRGQDSPHPGPLPKGEGMVRGSSLRFSALNQVR